MRISVVDAAPQPGLSGLPPGGKPVLGWRSALAEFRKTPNQVTLARIAATFALYGLLSGDRFWFVAVFVFACVTDWLDGYLARRLQQASFFGMRLDTAADIFLIVSGLWWITRLCPDTYRGHGILWSTVVVALAIPQLVAFAKLRSYAGFHLWSAKIAGVLALATFLSRVTNSPYAVPLVLAAAAIVYEGIEEVAVCLLVPDPFADPQPSIFHHLRAKGTARNSG